MYTVNGKKGTAHFSSISVIVYAFSSNFQQICRNTWLSISTGDSTAAELRLALIITLTLTDTGFAVLTLLLGYRRRSPDPNAKTQEVLS